MQKQESKKSAALPTHKFHATSTPDRAKSQIRAVAELGGLSQREFEDLAVALADKHGSASTLVQFFSSKSALDGWDGTGLLRDSDWPHWLCRITVETDSSGKLHAGTFKLALDETTGTERTDVLRR